jgi:Zn-finger nucleic acid-binding protein
MADPYREPSGRRCPRCGGVLTELDDVTTCAIDKRVDGAVWWTLGTGDGAKCPRCARRMMTYGTLYEYCPAHGAWVDAMQRNNFLAHFAGPIQRAQRVETLAAEVAEAPDAIATRIVELEREVAELRERLARLERLLPPR